jgi:fructokinase
MFEQQPHSGSRPEVVVSGEVVADLVADEADAGLFRFHPGGQGVNVAIALARQGLSTTLLMPLSRDPLGQSFAHALRAAGVGTPLAGTSPWPTSLALVNLEQGEPHYTLYREGVADRHLDTRTLLPRLPARPAIHVVGAFCYAVQPDRDFWLAVAAESRRRGALISSDPNIRPQLMERQDANREDICRALGEADIVKASHEDLAWLFPGDTTARAMGRLLSADRTVLAVGTLGGRGALLATRHAMAAVPAHPPRGVVDTIGAGDAFHAALLACLLRAGVRRTGQLDALSNGDLRVLGREAAVAAALNCEHAGCHPPSRAEVAQTLALSPG